MNRRSIGKLAGGAAACFAIAAFGLALTPSAHAQDFFSALFGGFRMRSAPEIRMPFPPDDMPRYDTPRQRAFYGGGTAYCVRGCDGRYFPAQGNDAESKAQSCKSFCPTSETSLVYGSNIDDATTDKGKSYSDLPNAFRFRNEIVAGCTCNGKDPVGLAQVKVEDDPTLRKGDIVAGSDGLVVASRNANDRRGVAMNFSPLPESVRARFRQVPVVAKE
ncbi:hypothetical protein MA20_18260 [Bradyrhizobium japonicum]|uniref:DUF2865 domain-containing protein n=1 Tax=Bradyrhizobium japonicum TaxID=375 RepID=A0A0A3YWS6_BRAJP|nr:DUF2865 domain-containing protein [Bradyrhizobium japonicum]KGT78083.1 hypothetical protein MA20_18260 [Bradyrhizobium japonicum]MCS3899820.1 hypothetical protein [Bradyrhizobium japonicum USDA 38]MCS3942874.1 hypothetical protein [Bradyrhizobium japonicum]MCW2224424.1 hypothetical protein [Bradyrhizobium japonicum]MCW2339665.1 hypothetical protein [Bradyrhizobium japonicum]